MYHFEDASVVGTVAYGIVSAGLFWSSLGLAVTIVSLYGMQFRGRGIVNTAFWSCLLLAYAIGVSFRIALLTTTEPIEAVDLAFNLMFVLETSLLQFSFAVVVLLLQKLAQLCDPTHMQFTKVDKLWLCLSMLQLPMNCGLATVRYFTHAMHHFWWFPINLFIAQLTTLAVFFYYRKIVEKFTRTASLSIRTHDLLEYTMERFAEFCLVYLFYACIGLCGMVASIGYIVDSESQSMAGLASIYMSCGPAGAFYVTLSAMYIFRPRWYAWMRKLKVGDTFHDAPFMNIGVSAAPSVLSIISTTRNAANGVGEPGSCEPVLKIGTPEFPHAVLRQPSLSRVEEESRMYPCESVSSATNKKVNDARNEAYTTISISATSSTDSHSNSSFAL